MITVADSIGIKLIRPDCLLTGVGNELHQYYLDSSNETVHRQFCLGFRSKIYGIDAYNEPSPQFVVVHGGRELAIFSLHFDQHLKLIKSLSLNDWISSIRVYEPTSNDEISFCMVSAHSVASEFIVKMNGEWSIVHKASCTDKCTLYCSLIVGRNWDETIIFGGTAFGELIIWQANGNDQPREVLQRVSGHNVNRFSKGVIFSIDCFLAHNLITTTSDDRSVKVWKFSFPFNEPNDWSACTIESSKSMFGHTARIFSHKIIESNDKIYIITVGEDSSYCVWSPNGQLKKREPIPNSVSLWNLDYDSNRKYLFACGNDGNVHQINLMNILNDSEFICDSIKVEGIENGEYIRNIVVMQSEAMVVGLTSNQKLFYGKIEEDISKNAWKPLPDAETGYKITVLETYGSLVVTGGYQFLTIYKLENGQFKQVYHNKPPLAERKSYFSSLQFLNEMEFIICDARGNGAIITIDESFNMIKNQPFQMPPGKERWITVAACLENYIIIGDRHGNMHLFERNSTVTLKHTLWHVHGNLGCKAIFQINSKKRLQFDCTGHQGKMKTIVINDINQKLEIKSTHEIPIKWCDKSIYINDGCSVLLAGFNERHFIAWRNDDCFRFEFECGGGHRAWDLYIDNQTSKVHLFFVRSKVMNCVQFNLHDSMLHPFKIPKNNWHTKSCNTMCIIQLSNERNLIASGGDDNLLKFTEINTFKSNALKHDFDMVLHISNIRSIFSLRLLSSNDNGNWLIFSAGGRAQICVTEIKIDHQQCVQFHEVCNFMLRSSDLERKRTKQTQIISFDPETRFMSLVSYYNGNDIYLVVGCSDGYIRTFKFENGMISLETFSFYGRCILHTYHFKYIDHHYLITMATDGLIAFWSLHNFNENSKSFFNLKHHDSGINSFDIHIVDNRMFVATGGDDQAIVISILQLNVELNNKIGISVLKTVKFPYSHTAQVNGVKFSIDQNYLYSASVDQTILKVNISDFSIKQAAYSCISDAKGLQIIDLKHILVYGCGMQILKL